MKKIKLFISALFVLGILCFLNTKIGNVPALGKFLNPVTGIWQNENNETISDEVVIPGLIDKVVEKRI